MQSLDTLSPAREQWLAAKARLRETYAALNEEVRAYPSPIARCDVQLSKLIERRSAVHEELARAEAQPEGLPDPAYLALAAELAAWLARTKA